MHCSPGCRIQTAPDGPFDLRLHFSRGLPYQLIWPVSVAVQHGCLPEPASLVHQAGHLVRRQQRLSLLRLRCTPTDSPGSRRAKPPSFAVRQVHDQAGAGDQSGLIEIGNSRIDAGRIAQIVSIDDEYGSCRICHGTFSA